MTTIVNNPPSNNLGRLAAVIIILVVLTVVAYLGYVYGLPALKQAQSGDTQVNIPDKIDVNINQKKDQSSY